MSELKTVELRKAGTDRWLARGSHLRHGAERSKKKAQVVEVTTCPRCGVERTKWERGVWKWTDDVVTFFHPRCAR